MVGLLCTACPSACTECSADFLGNEWLLMSAQTQHLPFLHISKFEDACLSKGDVLLQKPAKLEKSWKQQSSDLPEWISQTACLTFQLMNTARLVDATNQNVDRVEQTEMLVAKSSWPLSNANEIKQPGLTH